MDRGVMDHKIQRCYQTRDFINTPFNFFLATPPI